MHTLPGWCGVDQRLLGRDEAVEAAIAAARRGAVSVVGAAGMGSTSVAGRALMRLVDEGLRPIAIRAHASTILSDLLRTIGVALGVRLVGDQTSVARAVHATPTIIFIDDADLARRAVRELMGILRPAGWLLSGRDPLTDTTVTLGPLADISTLLKDGTDPALYAGCPLLTTFPDPPAPNQPWAAVDALPPGVELLAEVPMGVKEPIASVDPAYLVAGEARQTLRRSVREALGVPSRPGPATLAAVLRPLRQTLTELAADVMPMSDFSDIPLFRETASQVDDADLAALAGAAAARLLLRAFQISDALTLVRGQLQESEPNGTETAILRWLEGDALYAQGSLDEAQQSWARAADLLSDDEPQLMVTLACSVADRWAARGDVSRARQWLEPARAVLRENPDPTTQADALRIAGSLAALSGELVGAGALLDEATAALAGGHGSPRARAAVALGQAGLALARGQLGTAESRLSEAERLAASAENPVLNASVTYRRAEVALRRGEVDSAEDSLEKAEPAFAAAGSLRGLILCARMRGDVAAVGGDRLAAVSAYREALDLCVRVRDIEQLRRVLRRLIRVERDGIPGPHVDELEELLDTAEALRRAVS